MIKISIIIPVYNGEKFIKETLLSILNQAYKNFEIIIINDNSNDNSEKIILKLLKNFKNYVYLKNKKNINIAGSRNKGLKIAKGKYICFLDQDDLFSNKNKLESQLNFLDNNKDYGMVGSGVIQIDEDGNELTKIKTRISNEDIKNHIIMSNQFACGSVMFRKKLVLQIGYLNKKYNKSDDYDYWLKIGKISKIKNIEKYLFSYRIHSNNTTFKGLNKYKMKFMGLKLALIHGKYYPNFGKQIIFRLFGDFIIPNKLIQILIKRFKNKI